MEMQLKKAHEVLVPRKEEMRTFLGHYFFERAGVDSRGFLETERDFVLFVSYCLNTRQRKVTVEFDAGISYFREKYSEIFSLVRSKNLVGLQELVYSAPSVGQKIGSMIIEFIFMYSRYEDDTVLLDAHIPIDTHTKRILEDSFGVMVPDVGTSIRNRKFVDFQNDMASVASSGKGRVYLDYLWYVGKVFCTKESESQNKGYRLCSACWIRACCRLEKW